MEKSIADKESQEIFVSASGYSVTDQEECLTFFSHEISTAQP